MRGHDGHEDEGVLGQSHSKSVPGVNELSWHEPEGSHSGGEDVAWRLRTRSPLSRREEHIITKVIGCAMAVHRELGPGFLESIYKKAMLIELEGQGVGFQAERPIRVTYKGIEIPGQRVDLIVEGLVVVELKTVTRFHSIHIAQVLSYLKTLNLRGGLLINFMSPLLRSGLKRVVR